MKISEKTNGRITEKWLNFPLDHSDQRNRLLIFTPAFFRRFKDLEPMLTKTYPGPQGPDSNHLTFQG